MNELSIKINAEKKPENAHERTYNKAFLNDVAIIIPGPNDGATNLSNRDIIFNLKNGKLHKINELKTIYSTMIV